MIRKVLFILAACAVFVIVPASAQPATQSATVSITKAGYVPASVTINQGDSVTWTNADTVNHQVTSGKAFASPTLTPGQSFTFKFTTSGKFAINDPLDKTQKGTVVVNAPTKTTPVPPKGASAVTLSASTFRVVYGTAMTLSGTVSTKQAGESVTVQAQRFADAKFASLATVTTGSGGVWSYSTKPTIKTSYQAQWKSATSSSATVGVKPLVTFHVITGNRFSTRVAAARSVSRRIVQFQRRSSLGQWVTVKQVRLNASSTAIFRATLPKGTSSLRVAFSVNQAGAGYLGGISRTIVYHRA